MTGSNTTGFTTLSAVTDERRQLAALLRTLSPQQWNTESLCAGWLVRDVVAHLLYASTPLPAYLLEVARAGGSNDRLNDLYIRRGRTMTLDELLTAFESTIRPGPLTRSAPRIILADTFIHHQDIRRPLGLPREIPEQRLAALLRHPDPFLRPRRRMRGLRFTATDVDWQHGDGPTVQGPGEAIVMAIAGRSAALADLGGAGVDILRERLGAAA
ncbi:maleylpyruvate isomerase family mycothiol-dependent enzyme [Nocardia inohanensis]|uniref:maleylpyruvate isomerase family mycothiol-dependent enzyme n=1 Tax=Nocardia inohanensis TaxID=209246 RepID=UPI00082A5DE8|nr:maleylpyruvate isomerase family mycothiol-dependent enzyme [Nocardia inohanensis]